MAFAIPNEADAGNANQAEIDAVDIDILVEAAKGNGVVSGCAVTPQGTPDNTVAVAAGVIKYNGLEYAITGGNVTVDDDLSDPRFYLITASTADALAGTSGTAEADPVFPIYGDLPANTVVLAAVYVAAGDNDITDVEIVDKRGNVYDQTLIQDADGDTKIQVEESADEDIIRMDVGGLEALAIGDRTARIVMAITTAIWGTSGDPLDVGGIWRNWRAGITYISEAALSNVAIEGLDSGGGLRADGGTSGHQVRSLVAEVAAAGGPEIADSETAIFSEIENIRVKVNVSNFQATGTDRDLDVTLCSGIKVAWNILAPLGGGTISIADAYGIWIVNPNSSLIVNYNGVKIEDDTAATGTVRLLEVGDDPLFRVVGNFTDAANETPVYISEGVTPTLRQLKAVDTAVEVFVRAILNESPSNLDDWAHAALGASDETFFHWLVPGDFQSITSLEIIHIPDAAETVQADIDVSVAAAGALGAGEAHDVDTRQALNQTQLIGAGDVDDLIKWDITGSIFTGLAVGDTVAIRFQSDTMTLRVVGLLITYVGHRYAYLE